MGERVKAMCIVTDAPIVLCVGSERAPGSGYMCQAGSLPDFFVCFLPWLEQGMVHIIKEASS